MRTIAAAALAFALLPAARPAAAPGAPGAKPKVVTQTAELEGRKRSYLTYVPAPHGDAAPPLLLLLHGTGDDARMMIDSWKGLADREGIVLVAMDAAAGIGWQTPVDGPDALGDLVRHVSETVTFDVHRMYLFGHSGGASFGIMMALAESQFFAAAAVHAGVLTGPKAQPLMDSAARKIPIEMLAGVDDELVPIDQARATAKQLVASGFPTTILALSGHTHDYAPVSDMINKKAWQFLSAYTLDAPQFVSYATAR